MTRPTPGQILRFQPGPPDEPLDDTITVVLDTAWADPHEADPDRPVIGLRGIAERLLRERDLIEETSRHLDAWAEASDVAACLTADGTSFWYHGRLAHWLWLQERILWLGIVDELVITHSFVGIETAPGVDQGLIDVLRRIADRDAIGLEIEVDPSDRTGSDAGPAPPAAASGRAGPGQRRVRSATLVRRVLGRLPIGRRRDERSRRRRFIRDRFERLAAEPEARLLVLLQHARQRVDRATGPALMNAYLGPVIERLSGTSLEPIELDIRARLDDDAAWLRLTTDGSERLLPRDVVWSQGAPDDPAAARVRADEACARVAAVRVPVVVSGVDLGPDLAAQVAAFSGRWLADQIVSQQRIAHLLRRLRPAGILLADEYHRQDWLGGARLAGVRTGAIQHGVIYARHNGYMHGSRPASLRLPDRTYVFGEWERRLLVQGSVYRDDEVRVGGSPRLDLVVAGDGDREAVRSELGVAPEDRMVVVSGSWGSIYRRFHYPIALARILDRPLPRVHVVVKLHPGEPDEGPYRAVIEGVAAVGGFAPPPITVVQSVDLYRLLRAADAHLGVHSTVLTEAVATGTRNLLAATLAGSDLLGYVDAGVAIPVASGADLLDALDTVDDPVQSERTRRAFLDDHFRPANASDVIATDLLDWLA